MTFSMIFQNMYILQKMCVFLLEKQCFSRFATFICSSFFFDVLIIFRHCFDYFSTLNIVWTLYDFGSHFSSIFHPFSTLWPSFLHTCSMSIFHDFQMAFWTTFCPKSTHPTAIPDVTFFKKKNHVFSGPPDRIDF